MSTFALSDEHQALREAVRALADDKIAPRAAEIDRTAEFPWDVYDSLVKADFHAVHIPESYGGAGGDALAAALVIEEVARACATSSLIPAVNKLGTMPLLLGASEEVKQRYLPPVARGEAMFSYGLSEPEAGSDAGAMRTRAARDGRRVPAQRREAVDHERGRVEVLHGDGGDGPGQGRQRDLGVRSRGLRSRLHPRRARAQARHQGVAHPRALLRQLRDPGRSAGRRRGPGVQDRAAHPGPHPRHDRGAGAGHRPGRARLRGRLREGAQAVRPRRSPSSRACSSWWPTWP